MEAKISHKLDDFHKIYNKEKVIKILETDDLVI